MGNLPLYEKENIPPGWNYNPARRSQRIPIIILAFIGLE
jgi:hypothetical protein